MLIRKEHFRQIKMSSGAQQQLAAMLANALSSMTNNSATTNANANVTTTLAAPVMPIGNYNINSKVKFFDIPKIFDRAEYLTTKHCDADMIGYGFTEQKQARNGSIYLDVGIQYAAPFGASKYTLNQLNVQIPFFSGEKRLGDLEVFPFFGSEADKDQFLLRGQRFVEMTQQPTYLHCNGYLYIQSMFGYERLPINSRVMVDPDGYQKIAANRWYQDDVMNEFTDKTIYLTFPTVPVYSLEYRAWGEVQVDKLQPIKFDETAYDRIVLPDSYRSMIRNLVENFYKVETTDFIEGKKSGLYFLLNGPPGTGKTLTATGIAELCHRPLYSVGSGDLGTNPAGIEKKLKSIFDMVGAWNGIVLIDEADVFMSQRTSYNLEYNSCVSVFLRLVEAYTGVLIMTTNRNSDIDDAFDSRIDIRLHYDNLDLQCRAKVWYESLKRYNNQNIDIDSLAVHELNNREISRIVKLANIAEADPAKVTTASLSNFITLRKNFKFQSKNDKLADALTSAVESLKGDTDASKPMSTSIKNMFA
jgi:hypothetical protein